MNRYELSEQEEIALVFSIFLMFPKRYHEDPYTWVDIVDEAAEAIIEDKKRRHLKFKEELKCQQNAPQGRI